MTDPVSSRRPAFQSLRASFSTDAPPPKFELTQPSSPNVGSPAPRRKRLPWRIPGPFIFPRLRTLVLIRPFGPRLLSAAPVVKSLVFEASVRSEFEFHEKRRAPCLPSRTNAPAGVPAWLMSAERRSERPRRSSAVLATAGAARAPIEAIVA